MNAEEVKQKLAAIPEGLKDRVDREYVEMFEAMWGPLTTENAVRHFAKAEDRPWRISLSYDG